MGQVQGLICRRQQLRFIMGGLDGGGKTTILQRLTVGEIFKGTVHTIGMNYESFDRNNINFDILDSGGGEKLKPLLLYYYHHKHGLIFVVDSTDHNGIVEAKEELERLLNVESLQDVIVLVFANKQDLPNAMSKEDVSNIFTAKVFGGHQWHIQPVSAYTGEGLYEGFDWLTNAAMDKIITGPRKKASQ